MKQHIMRISAVVLVAALCFCAGAATAQTVLSGRHQDCKSEQQHYTPIQQRYERGLFFRVEKCGYPASYVMGTLHSDSAKLAPVLADAQALMQGMKGVGFEFIEDEKTAATAQQYMFFPSTYPHQLSELIPEPEYRQLENALFERVGLPRPLIQRMRPWAAAVTLQYPRPTTDGITLDNRLQQRAKAMQKTLFGLETPAEQFRVFDKLPLEQQVTMLRDAIAGIADMDKHNADFMQAYIARNLKQLHVLAEASFDAMQDAQLRYYLLENLITRRNHLMATRMQPHLRAGNVLVAVGALHLLGKEGILPLLEQQGWRVEVVR